MADLVAALESVQRANSVDTDQTAPSEVTCSGYPKFAQAYLCLKIYDHYLVNSSIRQCFLKKKKKMLVS